MLAAIERDCSSEVAVRPRFLSLKEAVVLAGIPEKEKCVRKDLEVGVFHAPSFFNLSDSKLCFNWPYVLTFAAVYGDDDMCDSRMYRKAVHEKVMCAISDNPVIFAFDSAMTAWHRTVMNCLVADKRVTIGRFAEINLGRVCESVKPRVDLYAEGLSRISEDSDILGGRPVFCGTRLSVHHVGKMVEGGETISNILEDYPYLTEGDVRFAALYYKARPLVGRPRASGPVYAHDVG